jgi:hypothetical protein
LLTAPAFVRLRELCCELYFGAKSKDSSSFALSNALFALGIPYTLTASNSDLIQTPEAAAVQLDTAYRREHGRRTYLCPLDMSDHDLPKLKFGPNRIRKFAANELVEMVDLPRLRPSARIGILTPLRSRNFTGWP